jgi:hypothetical protein
MLMITLSSFSQTVSGIVTVDSTLKKQTLYSNALEFFALEFKSANNVIQMKDAETGKVIGKGLFFDKREIIVAITCKDGKYKYDIEISNPSNLMGIIVDFGIDKYSYYGGKTLANILWLDGKPNLRDIRFYNPTPTYCATYEGNYPWGTKHAWLKWKELVDQNQNMVLQKYINDNQTEINRFISDLQKTMNKTEF